MPTHREHHGHDQDGHDEHGHDEHGQGQDEHAHDDHGHGPMAMLVSLVSPHDHGGHGADRELESTAEGIRAVAISLAALGATAVVQLVVALLSHSVALLADTIHNFADALTAVPLALAFRMGRRAPTRRYTYGFGRAEDLAGLSILVTITASTVLAAYEAVTRLLHPRAVHGAGWVIAAGFVGVLGNELVAGYRIRVGRRIGSAALVADGLHARSDGITSLAVVASGVAVAAGAPRADPVAGLVITASVLVVLVGAARTVYRRLMDSVDPELVDQIEQVLASVNGVERVDSVRIRWVGHELRAEIQVSSPPALSLIDAHAVAEEAHHRLLHDVARLSEAVIHTSPLADGPHDFHEAVSHHFPDRTASPDAAPDAAPDGAPDAAHER